MITRRGLLAGILAAGAAPAIVRAGSIMPIWVPKPVKVMTYAEHLAASIRETKEVVTAQVLQQAFTEQSFIAALVAMRGQKIALRPTNFYFPITV